MKFKCCAVCGSVNFCGLDTKCPHCGAKKETPINEVTETEKLLNYKTRPVFYYSRHDISYYENIAYQKFDDKDYWFDVFVEEELRYVSTFDRNKYIVSLQKANQYFNRRKEAGGKDYSRKEFIKNKQGNTTQQTENNTPKCPTCGSTNIKRISDLNRSIHALAFGIVSKTARSQFCCGNCGYKW